TLSKDRGEQTLHTAESVGWLVNLILPPGWLPFGAMGLAHGDPLPALLGTAGLTLISLASLGRAYRTTVRYYTGQFSASSVGPPPAPPPATVAHAPAYFLEKKPLWVSEPAAAIAFASLRSLLRAPEAKMMLLSPILLVIVFGSMFVTRNASPPAGLRPFL